MIGLLVLPFLIVITGYSAIEGIKILLLKPLDYTNILAVLYIFIVLFSLSKTKGIALGKGPILNIKQSPFGVFLGIFLIFLTFFTSVKALHEPVVLDPGNAARWAPSFFLLIISFVILNKSKTT